MKIQSYATKRIESRYFYTCKVCKGRYTREGIRVHIAMKHPKEYSEMLKCMIEEDWK